MNILIIIPARGGSKGIPRKNLRRLIDKPLIYYSIKTAIKSKYKSDIYVSSDDQEILITAKNIGSKIHKRNPKISSDETTLDPVIFDCYNYVKKIEEKEYDLIITMQPTSPLLKSKSLDSAIELIIKKREIDTVIAAKDSTHLSWKTDGNKFIPEYKERLNRQYLPPKYTETGAFLITRNTVIKQNNRIGNNVELFLLSGGEEIDIDTYQDWNLCEYFLRRKHILFVVTGNNIVGLGHVYNSLLVANDILNHQITFLVDKESGLAMDLLKSKNYSVKIQRKEDILEDIRMINPDVIVNDILDTTTYYIKSLKKLKYKVINFEDLGDGCKYADVVINAIYPDENSIPNHYFGQKYFILRDEFILSKTKEVKKEINSVLISFGGVDPNNFTEKVIRSIYEYCIESNIQIIIVAGYGYEKFETLKKYENIKIEKNVLNISEYMLEADLIFTSAGRTVYEVASIGTPTIVLAQNNREMTHFFASEEYGLRNLGLGYKLSDEALLNEFIRLINSFEIRSQMSSIMTKQDLKSGRNRVNKIINNKILD